MDLEDFQAIMLGMLNKPLSKVVSRPSPLAMHILRREVNEKLISIPNPDGEHPDFGFLYLILPKDDYPKVTGLDKWPGLPPLPGSGPKLHQDMNASEIALAEVQYQTAKNQYLIHQVVEQTIKSLILDAVPKRYLMVCWDLSHDLWGLARISACTIMERLWYAYGQATPDYSTLMHHALEKKFRVHHEVETLLYYAHHVMAVENSDQALAPSVSSNKQSARERQFMDRMLKCMRARQSQFQSHYEQIMEDYNGWMPCFQEFVLSLIVFDNCEELQSKLEQEEDESIYEMEGIDAPV